MSASEIIPLILSTIGGGVLGAFLTFKISLKKQNLTEFEVLINQYKHLEEKLQKRVDGLEVEQKRQNIVEDKLREKVTSLQTQLNLFESSSVDIPLPMWMKNTNGEMLFLNRNYEDLFLIPRGYNMADYIGYKDHAVWSKDVADEFAKNDSKVVRSKRPVRSIERLDEVNSGEIWVEILKYPRIINNKVIGISGIVLRTGDTKEELK